MKIRLTIVLLFLLSCFRSPQSEGDQRSVQPLVIVSGGTHFSTQPAHTEVSITVDDVIEGRTGIYRLRGGYQSSDPNRHDHTFTVNSDQITELLSDSIVLFPTSTFRAHSHFIRLRMP